MQGKMPVFSRYSILYRNVLSQGHFCPLSINSVWLSHTQLCSKTLSAWLLSESEAQTPPGSLSRAGQLCSRVYSTRSESSPRLSVQLRKSKHWAAQQPFQVFRPSMLPSQDPPFQAPTLSASHSPFPPHLSQSPANGLQLANLWCPVKTWLLQAWHDQAKRDNASVVLNMIFKLMLLKGASVLAAPTSHTRLQTAFFILASCAIVFSISWFSWWEKDTLFWIHVWLQKK